MLHCICPVWANDIAKLTELLPLESPARSVIDGGGPSCLKEPVSALGKCPGDPLSALTVVLFMLLSLLVLSSAHLVIHISVGPILYPAKPCS